MKIKPEKSKPNRSIYHPVGKTRLVERKEQTDKVKGDTWIFHLYIAGQIPKAIIAFNNLKIICEEQLKGKYRIEVFDLLKNPRLARDNQIFAVPTLVCQSPLPVRNIIGDLSDRERVLTGLNLVEYNTLNRP